MTIFNLQRGSVLIVTMIFLTLLSVMAFALASLLVKQHRLSNIRISEEYALQIAEAGLNYGRWQLAHDPEDFATVTKTLYDPEGGEVGTFIVRYTPPPDGSSIVAMQAKGWYQDQDKYFRVLTARYGKRAFTFYAFLFDSPVWFGGADVDGRVHSNEGIRMDATGNSAITTDQATYTCTAIHGCNPALVKPGIWGTGGNQSLWDFPVSNIDFNRVTTDLKDLHDLAATGGVGLFLSKNGMPKGYDLEFLSNGKVNVYKVTSLQSPVKRCRWVDGKWKQYNDSLDISAEVPYACSKCILNPVSGKQQYTLEPNDLIFAERDTWIRGTIHGRVTVVSASLPDISANNTNVILSGDITYTNSDGSDVLGVIGQKDVMISLNVPSDMRLDAVLMAQKGLIGRDYYGSSCNTKDDTSGWWLRDSITTYGSMISKDFSDPEFRWVSGGVAVAGFRNNTNTYDHNLAYNPPPYFPLMGDYEFISWEESEKADW